MTKACVIGWPIHHSRSPLIHGFWLKQLGISGSYERIPVKPEDLTKFIDDLPTNNYCGCNVTLPHKERVYHLVTPADESTRFLGAVNTVYIRDGRLLGTNTDGEGFINSLAVTQKNFELKNKRAVILGAGGAAMAIANAMMLKGVSEIVIVNRTLEKAENLRSRFGSIIKPAPWLMRADVLTDCDILVNTTSLGMKGQDGLNIDLSRLNSSALVTDIVYVPLRTKLLEEAAARGNPVVEGLGMLLHQAVRGFELWFGIKPEVTANLHVLIAKDIDPDYTQ